MFFSVKVSDLKVGGYIVINSEVGDDDESEYKDIACEICNIWYPDPESDRSYITIVGYDLFDGVRRFMDVKETDTVRVPVITMTKYKLIDYNYPYLTLIDRTGSIRSDIREDKSFWVMDNSCTDKMYYTEVLVCNAHGYEEGVITLKRRRLVSNKK